MCNSRIKFGVFHDRVGRHFAHVASGHYARTSLGLGVGGGSGAAGGVQLLRSVDDHKDQTYFLSQVPTAHTPSPARLTRRALHRFPPSSTPSITAAPPLSASPPPSAPSSQLRQEQISNTLFPIGGMSKPDVRKAAHALHLPNRERKDSQVSGR